MMRVACANIPVIEPSIICAVAYIKRSQVDFLTLKELTGSDSELRFGALACRPTEIWHMCADNARAREILGWTAKTPLREGLSRTIEWFREYYGNR